MPVQKPIEEVLPLAKRDEVRARCLGAGFYNPWLHLGATTVFGVAVAVAAATRLHAVRWYEALFALGVFVLANASEWRIHRDLLHQRSPLAPVLYDRHTPEHHVIYVTDDMAVRSRREWKLVLIPPYGIVLAFVGLAPLIAALWLLASHNLAALFALVTMLYVVSYEWLHLSYHLDPDGLVGGLGLVKALRRHHAVHHDPRLMQRWNFNVNLPLWDLVRRTYAGSREEVLARRPAAPRESP